MRNAFLLYLITCWFLSNAQELPQGFVIEEFIIGLSQPTAMAFAPDGRIFVAEKAGAVRVIENNRLLSQSFYVVETETPNERGLDGIVLDPDFDQNGYVYLYYTAKDERRNKVARVTAAGNTAIPNSEVEIFRFAKLSASWHNGGAMLFGTDDKLYVAIGDGTNWTKAPRLDYMLGKIVRINPDGSIPADNPLISETQGDHQSIYAYGVRNPYTMAISKSGRIFFNDVGNAEYEEVNELMPGANYGWNTVEGYLVGDPPDARYVEPIHVYDHTDGVKCAVVGAAFYEPSTLNFPESYHGKFFFMDYCAGTIWYMDPETFETEVFADHLDFPNNLAVGADGGLYIMQIKTGQIFRITYQGSGAPFITKQPRSMRVAEGDNVLFELETAGQDPFTYSWFKNGTVIAGAINHQLLLENISLDQDSLRIHAMVSNEIGAITSDTAILSVVAGSYPRPVIKVFQSYRAGDTIFFSGTAEDSEDGILPVDNLTWQIEFHHDVHTHPAFGPTSGLDSGQYLVGVFGEVDTNVFYRVQLEATDFDGLVGRTSADVHPEKVTLNLVSDPEGVELNIDGLRMKTNTSLRSVANLQRTVEVPSFQLINGHLHVFDNWADSDHDTLVRSFAAEDQLEISVNYIDSGFYHTGNGSKLQVDYYVGIEDDTTYYNTQHKDVIDENWDVVSPYRWQNDFPDDSFTVKWTGELVAPLTARYTFHILHDSRVSLILDDEILIDRAVDTSEISIPTEVTITLEAGQKYNFVLYYEHFRKWARVRAAWSYSVIDDQVIPATQFQEAIVTSDTIFLGDFEKFSLFPNPVDRGKLNLRFDGRLSTQPDVTIYNAVGKRMGSWQSFTLSDQLQIDVSNLVQGIYFIEVKIDDRIQTKQFAVH